MNHNENIQSNVEQINSSLFNRKKRLILIIICIIIFVLLIVILVPIFVLKEKPNTNIKTTTIDPLNLKSCPKITTIKKYSSLDIIFSNMIIADINGDNIEDIIISVYYKEQIIIFLNFANNILSTENIYITDIILKRMITCDINNDGKLDIIGIDPTSIFINILYNTGNGTFYDKLLISTNNYRINDIDVGYMNEDNRLDIVIITLDNIIILYNMGNNIFSNQTYQNVTGLYRLKIIDVNNDNKPDVIIGHLNPAISIILNNGNDTFRQVTKYAPRFTVHTILAININNDDKIDFIFGTKQSEIFLMLLNQGNGTFSNRNIYLNKFQSDSISIGDINNDQKSDLIIVYKNDQKISVHFNMGNGTFITSDEFIYSIDFAPDIAKTIDINGDGYMEIIIIGDIKADVYISILWIYC